eukprot:CAMPEP_0176376346 /NCGR_PEP_ID=MMETSP0126-20121128/28127_1 /TAXON_ID=141414 ORGANISM="Strombidinopsis acuminatum, Strain SPMC142" /NCGR_SAMPLE_ID=MMETSP0126 /ASSEMBLY_ACC=CAM_ASM_000229 /LENGTH=97 /DNA_ID=CAMNT_0017737753 /DNA_START=473 /DNA_END=766 /DNA_ORIENTATION=-
MSDDGTGFNVMIPAFLIKEEPAQVLKDAVRNGEHVVTKVTLEIAHPDNDHIEYELWLGSILDVDAEFFEDMYQYQNLLRMEACFEPRYLTVECPSCP